MFNAKPKRAALTALLAGLGLAAATSPSHANELILGVKAGIAELDANGFDRTVTGGVQLGYEFLDLAVADLAVEAEVTRSLTAADAPAGDYDYQSLGLFVSARTAGPIYVIGRAGVIDADITRNTGADTGDSGAALSIGIGSSVGMRWELEMTTYDLNDSDVTLFTFGVHF